MLSHARTSGLVSLGAVFVFSACTEMEAPDVCATCEEDAPSGELDSGAAEDVGADVRTGPDADRDTPEDAPADDVAPIDAPSDAGAADAPLATGAFVCPNEPPGMRRASEIVFDDAILPVGTTYVTSGHGIVHGGWMRSSTGLASISSFDDAPVDPPYVYTFHFRPGHRFGTGGGTLQGWEGDPADREARSRHSYEEYYECGWMRVRGPDAAPDAVEVSGNGWKVLGYWGAGCDEASRLPTMLAGWGHAGMSYPDGTLRSWLGLELRTSGCVSQDGTTMPVGAGVNRDFRWNRPGASDLITIGTWHRYEVYFRANTVGSDDGIIRVWLDGTPSHDFGNVRWRDATHARGFFGRHYNPVYNGLASGSGRLSYDAYVDVAGIYISLRGAVD